MVGEEGSSLALSRDGPLRSTTTTATTFCPPGTAACSSEFPPPSCLGAALWPDPHTWRAPCSSSGLEHMDAVFCPTCHMWLADSVQLEDHNRGKRHRRAA
eukprot:9039780-Lingulodinium_polyedra.AAC.1